MSEYNNIIIEQENGSKAEYEVLAIFEVADNNYVALLPMSTEDSITFYGCNENLSTNELELSCIEDEGEFELVSSCFVKLMENYASNEIDEVQV